MLHGAQQWICSLINVFVPTTPGPKKTGELSKDTATGVAILKGQNDPPIKPDNEYPPWLFKLLETEATVVELQRVYEGTGLTLMQVG